MNIAIIPARGGSKRIPGKNIKLFKSKPMISWAIENALKSGVFSKVYVSTDSDEIADISTRSGAEVPFLRPEELSNDHAPTLPVVKHMILSLADIGVRPKNVCCIYPCTPFLNPDDIRNGLRELEASKSRFLFPVISYSHPIQRAMKRSESGHLTFLEPSNEMVRTQDLNETFFDAGQFYWGTYSAWVNSETMHSGAFGLQVPGWRFVDIDNLDDWKRAEIYHEVLLGLKLQK